MIDILFCRIQHEFSFEKYHHYLAQLPLAMQETNRRFIRWQDRHAHLMGKILLLRILENNGFMASYLNSMAYSDYGRPSLPGVLEFNISHSGEYVLCASSRDRTVGVDIEQIKPVDFDHFRDVMTGRQWEEIYEADDPLRKFFTYWTIKESVIKADGKGLSIPLQDIEIRDGFVITGNVYTWYTHSLDIDLQYCATLATEGPVEPAGINLVEMVP